VRIMPIKIKFTLSADEFLAAQIAFNRFLAPPMARFNYRAAIPVALLLVADGAAGFLLRWNIGLNLFLIAFGAYLILCRVIIGPRKVKKEFTQYPDHDTDRTMEFNDEKILVQTSHGKSELDWTRLSRFIETDGLFVLFAPPRMLYTIPKRIFSIEETNQFREFLQRKLPAS
jgi:hypothetical protein